MKTEDEIILDAATEAAEAIGILRAVMVHFKWVNIVQAAAFDRAARDIREATHKHDDGSGEE